MTVHLLLVEVSPSVPTQRNGQDIRFWVTNQIKWGATVLHYKNNLLKVSIGYWFHLPSGILLLLKTSICQHSKRLNAVFQCWCCRGQVFPQDNTAQKSSHMWASGMLLERRKDNSQIPITHNYREETLCCCILAMLFYTFPLSSPRRLFWRCDYQTNHFTYTATNSECFIPKWEQSYVPKCWFYTKCKHTFAWEC